jgi:hypothetical protein
VRAGSVDGGEDTGGLDNVLGAGGTPLDLGSITLAKDSDGLAVDVELAVFGGALALESAVGLRVSCTIEVLGKSKLTESYLNM